MDKKKKIIIIVLIIAILLGLLIILLMKKDNKLKPYVEEKNIKVLSNQEFEIPFKPYAKDEHKTPMELDGLIFEDTKGTYKFYDYNITESDEKDYVIYSFKYDVEVPIKYTVDTSKTIRKWTRSYAFLYPVLFDYYTGEVYKERHVALSGKINYYDAFTEGTEDMEFINITWDNKTYKIGVRIETSSSWDQTTKTSNNNIDTYNTSNKVNVITYIYAPKDYDGLMLALNKNGTSIDTVLNKIVENNKLTNETYKLLDSQFNNKKNTKDDFYVIKINEIKKISD